MINLGTVVNLLCNPNLVNNYNESFKNSEPVSVTFCIPGNEFTPGFFNSWTKLLFFIKSNPNLITPHFVNYHSNNLAETCNDMLGGAHNKGVYQLPFADDFESKFVFFIEPDKVFEPLQVMQIIYKMIKYDVDIVSGVYFDKDNKLSIIENDTEEYFLKNKSFKNYNQEDLINLGKLNENSLCKVSNMGLGFVCIHNQLFSAIDYPWFTQESFEDHEGFYETNYSLFRKFKNNGTELYCDTSILIQSDK
jgi:hypothetical protein